MHGPEEMRGVFESLWHLQGLDQLQLVLLLGIPNTMGSEGVQDLPYFTELCPLGLGRLVSMCQTKP